MSNPRCPRCSGMMESWPYAIVPFCTWCGFELARRKTDRPQREVGNTLDGLEKENGHNTNQKKQD